MSVPFRIGIVSLFHESNTFSPGTTGLPDFATQFLRRGTELLADYQGSVGSLGGFIEGLARHGLTPVPLLAAYATPGPMIGAGVAEMLWAMLAEELARAGPLDGVLVAPHGAGVTESQPDLDGWWLTKLRQAVGPAVPIVGTLDPHANVSRSMLAATDALLPYKTNPHLDAKERGSQAVDLLVRTLRGQMQPVQVVCAPPVVINIERQHTAVPPLRTLCQACDQAVDTPGILDASVLLGYHYADVPEMGSGILVIADRDSGRAAQTALALGRKLWEMRAEFQPVLISVEQAIAQIDAQAKPVCLLDMGDNIGGGGSGEGTWLLHAFSGSSLGRLFCTIFEPSAAQKAIRAGVGARVALELGGRSALPSEGPPFALAGIVRAIPPETYHDEKPRHGGRKSFTIGPNALVQSDDGRLHVLITSRRASPNSIELMRNCGVLPGDFDVVVAKGVNGPLGAFDGHCRTFLKVNTPGLTAADLGTFTFARRRRPLFPFELPGAFDWNQTIFGHPHPASA